MPQREKCKNPQFTRPAKTQGVLFDDDYFMRAALLEARRAYEASELPIGAVVVSRNKTIARAHNRTEALTDATAHAEMQALTAASHYLGSKYLLDCALYVTLEPCVMCAGGLYWTQISRVIYGAADPKRGYTVSHLSLHPRTRVDAGVLAEESAQLIQAFLKNKRN